MSNIHFSSVCDNFYLSDDHRFMVVKVKDLVWQMMEDIGGMWQLIGHVPTALEAFEKIERRNITWNSQ